MTIICRYTEHFFVYNSHFSCAKFYDLYAKKMIVQGRNFLMFGNVLLMYITVCEHKIVFKCQSAEISNISTHKKIALKY